MAFGMGTHEVDGGEGLVGVVLVGFELGEGGGWWW